MYIKSAKDLDVYKLAHEQSMDIFLLSKKFPKEEKYSLTSQIRKASRSVCANLKEAWSKRRYIAHFISKLIPTCRDDGENACRPTGWEKQKLGSILQRIASILE